jgi:hypothetical protein
MENFHIFPNGGVWRLVDHSDGQVIGDYPSKEAALREGAMRANCREGWIRVHRADGTIDEEFLQPDEPVRLVRMGK